MDKLKDAMGMGGKSEEGQEPASGAKGQGTATQPFDAGNSQETTQTADKTADASEFDSEHAYLGSAIDADDARDADASKSETTTAPSTTATTEENAPPSKEEKKGGGGFMKSFGLGGGGGGNKRDEEKEAQAGAERAAEEKAEAEKPLPPNHLSSAVPEGASKDLADPGTVAPGQTDGIAQQQSGTTTTAAAPQQVSEPPSSPSSNSAGKQPDRGSSIGSGSGVGLADRSRSTGGPPGSGATKLQGSRGEHRGSMIPENAPKYKRVENPNAIPTAGGKRIGEEQYATRRASMAPGAGSSPPPPPPDMKGLDREGSPDPVTAGNTEANTAPAAPVASDSGPAAGDLPPSKAPAADESKPVQVPEAKNTAPQQMKEFSMGDASKEAEAKPMDTGPMEDVPPEAGPGGETASSFTPTPSNEEKNVSSGGDGGAGKRRGSMFGKLKEKMKGKSSK